ncbi:MAG: hypothetical protein OXG44_21585 [Gammaproteobacteria bacterium]|nr:hypothetical protein [Gammaproteobacteria bacterium]
MAIVEEASGPSRTPHAVVLLLWGESTDDPSYALPLGHLLPDRPGELVHLLLEEHVAFQVADLLSQATGQDWRTQPLSEAPGSI